MISTICIAEDRAACEPALKLLLSSLSLHSPEIPVSLFYPVANKAFILWIKRYPQIDIQNENLQSGVGWDVKPQAIMRLIERGFEEVIWIDSDVIINGSITPIFSQIDQNTLVAAEDALGNERSDTNALRARFWGFPVGRILPFGLNSGVLRVTSDHYSLMERWWELLMSDVYRGSQNRAWQERPVHMLGDQDVLTALLTSEEFFQVPLYILRRGKHVLQFNGVYGYTVAERIRTLLSTGPTFIHSFGGKPWNKRWSKTSPYDLREYIKDLYLDLSPYTLLASHFKEELDCDIAWMEPHYRLAQVLRLLGVGSLALTGLPIAIFADVALAIKSARDHISVIMRPASSKPNARPQTRNKSESETCNLR